MIARNGLNFCFERKNSNLRIACILDEFSYKSFEYECELLQITPKGWKLEIENFHPDFLLVESAWAGKDELWGGKIIETHGVIGDVARFCAKQAIPIVFWNKEDPFGYDAFLPFAKIADVVFTTAGECVEKYKKDLGHSNVYFMHFAVQPKLFQNKNLQRKDKFCFAGAYYKSFPERIESFDRIFRVLDEYKGVDIYDRFYFDRHRRFPRKYQKNVLGTLKFNDIYKAYYGYKYNINMNSITDSETMFARRVFELLYAKTVVVSNYSKGLVKYFGDLVISTDDTDEMIRRLKEINSSEESLNSFCELGYKRVVEKELYSHRLEQICKVLYE